MAADHDITRKDFLNAALVGVGAALLHSPSPLEAMERAADKDTFTGPGGVGDYARSNGNTKPVMDAAHRLRDGGYARQHATDTGEVYDLVVVGGGITGLSAAYFFAKATGEAKTCLVLENHPIFGGEAKQNEFLVNGVRLIAPQGSNDFGVPRAGSGWQSEMWDDLHMPREFTWSGANDSSMTLRMAQDNYQPMDGIGENAVDVGYFFDSHSAIGATPKPTWLRNVWRDDLKDVAISDEARAQLLSWRTDGPDRSVHNGVAARPEEWARWLDTMTYKDYLANVGLGPDVIKLVDPIIGLISGASPDAVSAHAAQQIGMPGVSRARPRNTTSEGLSFPGGNVTYARHLVKKLIPDSIGGEFSFEGVMNGTVNWAALDRTGQPTRVRVGTTVSRVEHQGDGVRVTYAKGGALYTVRARRVAMAVGGWVNKYVLADAPTSIKEAYSQFYYAPALIVNVALTNWKFMDKLGITAARWFGPDDVGFIANLRRQMKVGSYDPPVDPTKPNVLTFYMGLYTPGKTVAEQGSLGRAKLLGTTYAQYEKAILGQMTHQFASAGFDVKRDVAGVILNRWGHARLVQPPGWYYGVNGQPAPREVVSAGYGKIAIGHSELNGHQSATGAIAQGKRIGEASA